MSSSIPLLPSPRSAVSTSPLCVDGSGTRVHHRRRASGKRTQHLGLIRMHQSQSLSSMAPRHTRHQTLLKNAAERAHVQEKGRINEIAAAQASPAEQYQSYMASNAVKLMRDGLKGMRPPSNVREMEVLDKIARRHFGLDEKQSGGVGTLSIDINILNDAAAASRKRPTKVVDIDPNPKD